MKCEDWTELIDLYLDNELPESLRGRFERHLMRCAGCAFEVRTLEQTLDSLRDTVSPIKIPSATLERMEARLQSRLAPRLKTPASNGGQRTLRLV